MNVLIINGPNLNLLGEREPGTYGSDSYDNICALIRAKAEELGFPSASASSPTARAR